MTTLDHSAGTLRPHRLLGIAASEREIPGRDLGVLTLSQKLVVVPLHCLYPAIPTVTMLPPKPVLFGHWLLRPTAPQAARV